MRSLSRADSRACWGVGVGDYIYAWFNGRLTVGWACTMLTMDVHLAVSVTVGFISQTAFGSRRVVMAASVATTGW